MLPSPGISPDGSYGGADAQGHVYAGGRWVRPEGDRLTGRGHTGKTKGRVLNMQLTTPFEGVGLMRVHLAC